MEAILNIKRKSLFPNEKTTVIFCTNYIDTGTVINFPVTSINLRSIFDIGVWRIKKP